MDFLFIPILSLIILIFSAILHEIAHGYVADRLGDPTARILGRLTLDPRPHIDPLMSIVLPLLLLISGSPILFGGAKPVPVDPFNLKDGRKDLALVSLAGPVTNIIIAIIATLLFRLFQFSPLEIISSPLSFLQIVLWLTIRVNILLAIFNLLPIPPLDGSKVFSLILPPREAATFLSFGRNGSFLLLLLLLLPVTGNAINGVIASLYTLAMGILGF